MIASLSFDHEPLFENIDDNVLNRAKQVGIEKLITICTTLKSFERIKFLINKDKMIFGTFGIHPHETKKYKITSDIIIKEI